MKTCKFTRIKVEAKKNISYIRIQSQWLKQYAEFNTQKWIQAEKNGGKGGKALYKLMNNAVYGKTM